MFKNSYQTLTAYHLSKINHPIKDSDFVTVNTLYQRDYIPREDRSAVNHRQ